MRRGLDLRTIPEAMIGLVAFNNLWVLPLFAVCYKRVGSFGVREGHIRERTLAHNIDIQLACGHGCGRTLTLSHRAEKEYSPKTKHHKHSDYD